MPLNFHPLTLLLSFLVFIFLVTKHLKNQKKTTPATSKLPPGPWKLPLIGNILQLIGPLPHHTLTNLSRKHGPLMHLKLGEVSTIVISSPDTAKQALKDHDVTFAQRPYFLVTQILSYGSTNIIFSPYGDYWRQMRKICVMELLSSKRVQSYQKLREEEVFSLIESVSGGEASPVNLSKKIYSLTYGITSRAAFGSKCKHQDEFIELVDAAFVLATGLTISDMYPSVKLLQVICGMRRELEKMQKKIDAILETILCEHRVKYRSANFSGEAEDLVDVLLRIQKQGELEFPLSDDNIKAVILDIFGAGSETSSTVVEWAMAEMLKNPLHMERAQAEVRRVFDKKGNVDEAHIGDLKYLNGVIKETLRLHPPAPLLLPRENSEECEIDGFLIPAKSKVIINAWAIGRDPTHWTEPEKFDPERFLDSGIDFRGRDFEYIPFGAGRRICPGISFAMANIELPLAHLLYHFDWKLPNGMKHEELDMEEAFGITVKRRNSLVLVPMPHKSSQDKSSVT